MLSIPQALKRIKGNTAEFLPELLNFRGLHLLPGASLIR